ncbi:MAG: alcohol dehydrogenase [Planctomycetes bacterium]|nr:alcohol dehydrogenase [Planctomycetota bacterium]
MTTGDYARAAVLIRKGDATKAFAIEDRPIPDPAPGEVRVLVSVFGLNFADVLARLGLYPDAPPRPCVLGYEIAGVVDAVGADVVGIERGVRVCAFTRFGGYATHVVAPAVGVMPLPDAVDLETAAALPVQFGTAWYSAEEMVRMHDGDAVLIQAAAGGVGGALVQIAKARGARVLGTAGGPEKTALLRDLGVDHPIDYRTQDFAGIAREQCPQGLDVVFDSLGGSAFRRGLRLLAPGGRMVSFGVARMAGRRASLLRSVSAVAGFGWPHPLSLLSSSRGIIGVNMLRVADARPQALRRSLAEVLHRITDGRLRARIDRVFDIADLAAAHDRLGLRRSAGKVLVRWPRRVS